MMKLKEEQKRAALSARAAALKEQHEVELQKRKLEIEQRARLEELEIHRRDQEEQIRLEKQKLDDEMELSKLEFQRLQEELKLKAELNESDAKMEVLEKFDSGNSASSASIQDPIDECLSHIQHHSKKGFQLSSLASEFVPRAQSYPQEETANVATPVLPKSVAFNDPPKPILAVQEKFKVNSFLPVTSTPKTEQPTQPLLDVKTTCHGWSLMYSKVTHFCTHSG